MDVRGHGRRAHERAIGAGGDLQVVAAGELEDPQGVGRRLGQRLVAGDGRHPQHLDLGAGEGEQHRDRIVVTGVAVEQDRDRHYATGVVTGSPAMPSSLTARPMTT